MLIGTPHYMAPEQITTAMDVDARADIWAIGVILYELLVGETPFEAETANAVMKLVRTRDIAPIRARAPLTSRLVEDLVTRCLARDRTARYANASELRDELQRIRTELASGRGGADPAANAVPSLVIRSGGAPLKRRGSALLTLTRPDEMASSDVSAPKAIARPVEPPKAVGDGARPKAARTAADVIREAEALSSPTVPPPPALSRVPSLSSPPPAFSRTPSLSSLPPRSAPLSSPPPPSRLTSLSSLPPPSRSTSLSSLPPSPPSSLDAPPPSHATEQGAPRGLELDDLDEPVLDLDYSDPRSRVAPGSARASLPPVLDPRAASSSQSRSAPPPAPSVPPGTGQAVPSAPEKPRPSPLSAPESRGTPGLTPQLHARRSAGSPAEQEAQPRWPAKTKLAFGAAIAAPALAAFVALSFAPFVLAPLGRAMRGDSPLASGVLAVLTLVGAAVLAARALGESRSPGMRVAAGGAVLLGIVMIIVTFSASETAELEIPPAAGGLVPFIAPLVPLGLGLAAFTKAHSLWGSRYDRSEAIKLVALTSLLLLALLELTPLGAVRAATSASASAPSVHAPAPP
jgi:serine/threonine protein kinase